MRHLGSSGLGYGQVFILIFGFLVASGVIFFLGFLVGQMRTEWRLAQEERVVRQAIPVQPTPSEEKEQGVDLAFYQKLKEKAYARLQETPTVVAPTAAAHRAPAATAHGATPTPSRTPVRAPTKPAAPPTPVTRPKTESSTPGDEWADAGWTVQVIATTDSQQASTLARELKTKGYDAYTVQAPLRGQTWYRVRVGRFPSRAKAKELEERLKSDGMENAYITPQ